MPADQDRAIPEQDPLMSANEAVRRALESVPSHVGHVSLDGSEIVADHTIKLLDATGQLRRVEFMPPGEDQSHLVRGYN